MRRTNRWIFATGALLKAYDAWYTESDALDRTEESPVHAAGRLFAPARSPVRVARCAVLEAWSAVIGDASMVEEFEFSACAARPRVRSVASPVLVDVSAGRRVRCPSKRPLTLVQEVFQQVQAVASAVREARSSGPGVGIEWTQQSVALMLLRGHLAAFRDSQNKLLSLWSLLTSRSGCQNAHIVLETGRTHDAGMTLGHE